MVTRILLIFLCLGMLHTVTGCYVDPYPYGNRPYSRGEKRFDNDDEREQRKMRDRDQERERYERADRPRWEQWDR